MKIIEKISLNLFSTIVLLLSIIMIVITFGWLELELVTAGLEFVLNNPVASNTVLALSIIFILLAIKCIFFDSASSKNAIKEGILLENESGKLLVSKDTIENLTNGVVKGFEGTENITSQVILDKENNVSIDISLYVHPDAIIKDLSTNLQKKIKETIKKSLDLDVKEIYIKIRNIANPTSEKLPRVFEYIINFVIEEKANRK